MADFVQGILTGFAFGGLTVGVIEANTLALKMLWRFNRLAAKTFWDILNIPFYKRYQQQLESELQWRRRRALDRQIEVEDTDTDTDDET